MLPDYPQNRDEFELITLKDGDRVVGACVGSYPANRRSWCSSRPTRSCSGSRPLWCARRAGAAGGMAGVRLAAGASAVWFGAVDADAAAGTPSGPPGTYSPAVVVTVAGSASVLPGTAAGSVKVTPLHEFPGKGRATGGVRCHRFLKGEDLLVAAWAGPARRWPRPIAARPSSCPPRSGSGTARASASAGRWPSSAVRSGCSSGPSGQRPNSGRLIGTGESGL